MSLLTEFFALEYFLLTDPIRTTRYTTDDILRGYERFGRYLHDCVGSPPVDTLVKDVLVVDQDEPVIKEDTGDGTTIKFFCPPGCADLTLENGQVYGSGLYEDTSNICLAAIHAGAIEADGDYNYFGGAMVEATLLRSAEVGQLFDWDGYGGNEGTHNRTHWPALARGSNQNGVQSLDMRLEFDDRNDLVLLEPRRVFSVRRYSQVEVEVQTVAGAPGNLLEGSCGLRDATPAQEAQFNHPTGIAIFVNASATDTEYVYVADTDNHAIRLMTAVCSKVCENGGLCNAEDTCQCAAGWIGDDCTLPVCTTPCGLKEVTGLFLLPVDDRLFLLAFLTESSLLTDFSS
jgi:hypothetical protein